VNCEGSVPVISEAPVNVTVIAGESARFECIATGAPKPAIAWTRGERDTCYMLNTVIIIIIVTTTIFIVLSS